MLIEFEKLDSSDYMYINYFKQDVFEEILQLDCICDILQITKVSASINTTVDSFVNMPTGENIYGEKLTGLCIAIKHNLIGRIEYITSQNQIRLFSFDIPKTIYIAIDDNLKNIHRINSSASIDHIFVKKLSDNRVYLSSLFLSIINS